MKATNLNRRRTTIQRYELLSFITRGLQQPRRLARAGSCIILRGIANNKVWRNRNRADLLGISSPDGACITATSPNKYGVTGATNSHSDSPTTRLDDHCSFPFPESPPASETLSACNATPLVVTIGNAVGYALPYIIAAAGAALVIVEIIRRVN